MVAVRGAQLEETLRKAAVATDLMVSRIRLLGLKVALPKTEAIVFQKRGWRVPAGTTIPVSGEMVQVMPHIKYLGIVLDKNLNFEEHFLQLAPRIVGAASALGRLLPNIGGQALRAAACMPAWLAVWRCMVLRCGRIA
ncbi:uncharacterized protein LOC125236781 [Leguminivora glycinivorella]|uniref:uncharacterized protein LOC125236781 n=1 Tax=Leguminivora glycinivorella TaxID=1035111 RepID=UPI00201092E8|nr:uncharacterized protein LOC125236781 [Leguminivora glycinivorella]